LKKNNFLVIEQILDSILSKNGEDVRLLKVSHLTTIADYIIIASGKSDRQLNAINRDIKEKLKEKFSRKPLSIVGQEAAEWILMDYNDIIVHLFSEQKRDYYNLEELWQKDENILPLQKFGF